jgi:hypothetical protein
MSPPRSPSGSSRTIAEASKPAKKFVSGSVSQIRLIASSSVPAASSVDFSCPNPSRSKKNGSSTSPAHAVPPVSMEAGSFVVTDAI